MLFHSPLLSQILVCLAWSFNQPVLKRELGEYRQESVWEMSCLFVQPAITWLNCLLGCCALTLGRPQCKSCLFVYESLWLWLATSSSATEHTPRTKGWGKILLQFPIGKHSLSSLDIQSWGTDGRGWGRVGNGFSISTTCYAWRLHYFFLKCWTSIPLDAFYD